MKTMIILLVIIILTGCTGTAENTYKVTIDVSEGGFIYKEVITAVNFDGKTIGTNGIYTLTDVTEGKKVLTYSWGNINGYGMVLNPVTERKEIEVTKDMKIIIYGSKVYY